MAYSIWAVFAFYFGTILSYRFAGVRFDRKSIFKLLLLSVILLLIQQTSNDLVGPDMAERIYPLTTHLPLILWLILMHQVRWEVSFGAVITAYLCCELPSWVSRFGAIPFNSDYNIQVVIYCISSTVILFLLCRYTAPALLRLFTKSRRQCLAFTIIPLLYYIWCYSATVYTSYMEEYGYQVALTMSALFTFMYLIVAIVQNRHQEDTEIMKELERARNAELEAKQEAIRANRAKSDFLANMSHEIRTPINAVLGIDEMILRECTDPQILDYAAKIKASGQTLLSLINDILDMSKIESERMEIVPTEYEPQKLLSEVLMMMESRVDAKGLRMQYLIDPQIPRKLYGDDMRIRQILINLLSNAVKYTDGGTVTLSVTLLQKTDAMATLHFSVQDTGIGILEEDQKTLFEAFRRVDLAHNKSIEGTGLGLSITLKLLHLMESDLGLNSTYGVGSDFYFDLKQEILDAQETGEFQRNIQITTAADTYRESFSAPGAKVLVVDDNDMNLLVFTGLLKNSRMDIRTAHSGQEALDLIRSESFDLIFMDHMMPKMDGVEALQHILTDEILRPHAPVIIALTANAVAGARETYLKAGFSGYMTKPIRGPVLEQIILEFLPKHMIQVAENSTIADSGSIADIPVELPTTDPALPTLDQKLGLSLCAGDKNFYHEVLKAFVQSDFTTTLNDYFHQEDWRGYQITIHGAKSGAKSIGAMALTELALELELALKERDDSDLVKAKHPLVLQELQKVETIIEELTNPTK